MIKYRAFVNVIYLNFTVRRKWFSIMFLLESTKYIVWEIGVLCLRWLFQIIKWTAYFYDKFHGCCNKTRFPFVKCNFLFSLACTAYTVCIVEMVGWVLTLDTWRLWRNPKDNRTSRQSVAAWYNTSQHVSSCYTITISTLLLKLP